MPEWPWLRTDIRERIAERASEICEGIADSGRVAVDDVFLKLLRLLGREDRLRQLADAGRDAVHHGPLADFALDELAAVRDPVQGSLGQLDRFALPRNAVDILTTQPTLTDANAHRILLFPRAPGAPNPPHTVRLQKGEDTPPRTEGQTGVGGDKPPNQRGLRAT